MSKIRMGVIGYGNMGTGHCNSILTGKTPEIELTCVADIREVRRQAAKEALPKEKQ